MQPNFYCTVSKRNIIHSFSVIFFRATWQSQARNVFFKKITENVLINAIQNCAVGANWIFPYIFFREKWQDPFFSPFSTHRKKSQNLLHQTPSRAQIKDVILIVKIRCHKSAHLHKRLISMNIALCRNGAFSIKTQGYRSLGIDVVFEPFPWMNATRDCPTVINIWQTQSA